MTRPIALRLLPGALSILLAPAPAGSPASRCRASPRRLADAIHQVAYGARSQWYSSSLAPTFETPKAPGGAYHIDPRR
jgi:hypothetical protein